jgi:hypothetical protein
VEEWKKWATAFSISHPLSISRCFNVSAITSTAVELHIFADASESAFEAIAYLRFIQPDEIKIAFVMAKTRVAPIKYVSIPRLELCAALRASLLALVIS